MKPEEVFKLFTAAINRHDLSAVASRMTPDHTFIDSLANRVVGAIQMEAGWRVYFAMYPAYRIRTNYLMSRMAQSWQQARPEAPLMARSGRRPLPGKP